MLIELYFENFCFFNLACFIVFGSSLIQSCRWTGWFLVRIVVILLVLRFITLVDVVKLIIIVTLVVAGVIIVGFIATN